MLSPDYAQRGLIVLGGHQRQYRSLGGRPGGNRPVCRARGSAHRAEDLVEIALCAAQEARRFDLVPRVAMLSFSSFGSSKHPSCDKVRKAVELLHKADPTLIVDGEIMADAAVSPEILEQTYPFSSLKGGANVLVFPNLESANIAYKLLTTIGGAEILGPILMGMARPVHLLARGAEVEEIVNVVAIAVVDARESEPATSTPELEKAVVHAD